MRVPWAPGAALLAGLALVGGSQPGDQDQLVKRFQAKMGQAQASFYAWNTRQPVPEIQGQWRASFGRKQTSPRQVMLLSYPNSGTTWSKELFEDATGTASMAVYKSEGRQTFRFRQCIVGRCEGYFDERGMTKRAGSPLAAATKKPLRDVDGTIVRMEAVAFVKSHRTPRGVINLMPWEVLVHVVRNPIDNMVANLDFLNKKGKGPKHTGSSRKGGPRRRLVGSHNSTDSPGPRRRLAGSDKPPPSANQVQFMAGMMRRYVRWHCHAILGSEFVPTQTVLYEDLLENPVPQLKRILDFIGYTSLTIADYERSSKLHPAKYYPPLAPGLPTKWSRVSAPQVWEPLADAFLAEWLPIEAKLRVPRTTRNAHFDEICGDMGNGPFSVL